MINDIDYKALGARVREARLNKGISQEQLSSKINVSPRYISNIELAKSKVALKTLIAIANELDTTLDCLLYDSTPVLVSQYDADAREIMSDCTLEEKRFLLDLLKHAKEDLRKNFK